jgi:hypothetical protein
MRYDINEGYYCPIAVEFKKYKTLGPFTLKLQFRSEENAFHFSTFCVCFYEQMILDSTALCWALAAYSVS